MRDDGFSLVEVMVTLLIIGLLIAIGLPYFLGAKSRSEDAAAKSSAALALVPAKIAHTRSASYLDATVAELSDIESSLTFVDASTSSDDPKVASRDTPDAATFVVAVWSNSGTCFFAMDVATSGTVFGSIANRTTADCRAANAGAVTFSDSW
jgi:type IV pilus assembly protein PilA